MTRTAIAGIAAGSFTLGILAGLVLPGSIVTARHDQLIASHASAMASMPATGGGYMPMHVGAMPMMDMGSMPMGSESVPADHHAHHASPEVGQ